MAGTSNILAIRVSLSCSRSAGAGEQRVPGTVRPGSPHTGLFGGFPCSGAPTLKLLMLTRYGRLGASSRMRSHQYLPWLEAFGIEVTITPLLPDAYVNGLQHGRKPWREVLAAYPQRIWALLSSHRFDLIWIEKEALPWLPAGFELALMSHKKPYVLDYDDAVFHYYDQHKRPWIKSILETKHPALISGAALVVAGNAYLADYATTNGARRVELIPTVIDLDRYEPERSKPSPANGLPLTVGWIGQRSTSDFLRPLAPIFERLHNEGQMQFRAIGIDAEALGIPMTSEVWSEDTEAESIQHLNVGIMPLEDGPFQRGKCGYKLIQYMACSLPVVASPIGANRSIIEHGVNGFLAKTSEQWEDALRLLASDPAVRLSMGLAGRIKVEKNYCLQVTAPRLANLLFDVAASPHA